MMKWALIVGGVVTETTETDPAGRYHPDLDWREAPPDVSESWTYSNGVFAGPVVAPSVPAAPIRRITALAFRRRLSPSRRAEITMAASAAMDGGNAMLQVWLDDLAASLVVELDGAELLAGVSAMFGAGLISESERADLLADGESHEVP